MKGKIKSVVRMGKAYHRLRFTHCNHDANVAADPLNIAAYLLTAEFDAIKLLYYYLRVAVFVELSSLRSWCFSSSSAPAFSISDLSVMFGRREALSSPPKNSLPVWIFCVMYSWTWTRHPRMHRRRFLKNETKKSRHVFPSLSTNPRNTEMYFLGSAKTADMDYRKHRTS